jgi:thiol-disulfide isomerase/thioredoxin
MTPDQLLILQLVLLGVLTAILSVVWADVGGLAFVRRLPGAARGGLGLAALAGMIAVLVAPRYLPGLTAKAGGSAVDYAWPIVSVSDGKRTTLEQFKGKALFINFWATWCGPCIAEMPSIEKLAGRFEGRDDVVFLLISLDREPERLTAFLRQRPLPGRVFAPGAPLPKAFQTRGIPATFIVGKTGRIEHEHQGSTDWNRPTFVELLESLAAQ